MFGNTAGKNALEKGSSKSVGRSSEVAPASHSACGSPTLTHRRRTSHAISGNVTANRINVPFQSTGRRRCCPPKRNASVATSQMMKPVRRSRMFINMNMNSYSYRTRPNATLKFPAPSQGLPRRSSRCSALLACEPADLWFLTLELSRRKH
jgi:hypothetical protein